MHTTTHGPQDTGTISQRAPRQRTCDGATAQALLRTCLHDWGWTIEQALDWIERLACDGSLSPQ